MAVTMTEAAVKRVRVLCKKRQTPDAVLRVGVRGGGCSGLSYFMDFVEEAEEKDKLFEFGEPATRRILEKLNPSFEFEIATACQKDSLELTDDDRGRLAELIAAQTTDKVIVTHGTDTMVETAELLRGIEGKVIVLTGSLSPARFKISDAEFNLGMAIAAVQSLDEGVYITMNGKVFEAGSVVKNRSENKFEARSS